jgi:uncharacterized protein (DUF302 family)
VETRSGEQTYVVAERFDRALKLIRQALAEEGLNVAAEIDLTEKLTRDYSAGSGQSKLLLVDCPLLLFEALALDRGAGVFVPLHVLVSPEENRTRVVCVEPDRSFQVRLPAGAAQPLEELRSRVAAALA